MSIIGERGKRVVESEVRIAVIGLVCLLICHCFMWLAEFGGSVIVA